MPDLLTLSEYREAKGYDPLDTSRDAEIVAMLPAASQAIINFTGRQFGSPLVTETRSFTYDGSGFLDIDDAQAINTVSAVVPGFTPYDLTADLYAAMPIRSSRSLVYTYIIMPTWFGVSPEMGFARNIDMLWAEGRLRGVPPMVNVNAEWGWPVIPSDVRQAVIWTIDAWMSRPEGGDALTSEAIAGYARSWDVGGVRGALTSGIPSKAIDLLTPYTTLFG